MHVLYDTTSFIKPWQLPIVAMFKLKKTNIKNAWLWTWIFYPIRNGVNITIGRVACMIVYLMEEVLDVFVRKEHFQ